MPVAIARAPAKPYRHAGPHADPCPISSAATKSKSKLYNPRHPERSVLYRTVAAHFETWLALSGAGQFDGQGDHHTVLPSVGVVVAMISPIRADPGAIPP